MNTSPPKYLKEHTPCSVSSNSQRNYHTLVVGALDTRPSPPYSECSQSSGSRGASPEIIPSLPPFTSENLNEEERNSLANRTNHIHKNSPPSYISHQVDSFSASVEDIPYYPQSGTDVSVNTSVYQKENLRTFFFYTFFSIFLKVFLFAFYIGNIIYSSLSFTKCPYKLANLSNFMPIAMLFINSLGLVHLIFHVFVAWLSICTCLDSTLTNCQNIRNKISYILQGFQLFEIMGLLPLISFFLCTMLYLFLHITPSLDCPKCQDYCEESYYRFSSFSIQFFVLFVLTFTLVNLFLACIKYCWTSLLEIKNVHFYSQENNLN